MGRHVLGAAMVAVLTLSAGVSATTPARADDAGDMLSIVRGGRLYDDWARETRDLYPEKSHPAYPATGAYADRPNMNWRCVECHGWDYKGKDGIFATGPHHTGIKGINGMAGADPDKIVAVLRNETHRYDTVLNADELHSLALFVSKGQVDMDKYIDRESKKAKGDPLKMQAHYQTICANCHGTDGLKLRSIPPFGMISKDDPWQAFHKILNGHPAEKMPALRVLGNQTLADILAYIQTLPREELLSSIVRGGRLYDDWIKELDAMVPSSAQPAYPRDGRYANEPKSTWRCKECHGWDYKGKDGEYGKGSKHYTGIKGITGMTGADVRKVMSVLEDRNHRYGGLLNGHDILDLSNFVSQGQVDVDKFIDPQSHKVNGDANRHRDYYLVICGNCHGLDGTKIITIKPLGRVVEEDPYNALHKMFNGHPAEAMPALRALDHQILKDILAYIQTLPTKK